MRLARLSREWPQRVVRGVRTAVLLSVLLGTTACGAGTSTSVDAASPPSATATPSAPTETPTGRATADAATDETYVVFPDGVPADGWSVTAAARRTDPETVDLLDDVPGLEWSADYEDLRHEFERGPYIKVAEYKRALGDMDSADLAVKIVGTIAGRPAYWGTDPADPDAETFVVFALSPDRSVELTAVNVAVDDLRRYAAALTPATADAWVAAHQAVGVK